MSKPLSGHDWWATINRDEPERVQFVSYGMGDARPAGCHRSWFDARADIVLRLDRRVPVLEHELASVRGQIARLSTMTEPEKS